MPPASSMSRKRQNFATGPAPARSPTAGARIALGPTDRSEHSSSHSGLGWGQTAGERDSPGSTLSSQERRRAMDPSKTSEDPRDWLVNQGFEAYTGTDH